MDSMYLFGSETWNKLCHTIPVYWLGQSPKGAQHHVQNEHIVVVGKVVVVQGAVTHLWQEHKVTILLQFSGS